MPQLLFLGPHDAVTSSRRLMLKRAGYKVADTHDPEEALRTRAWKGSTLVILAGTLPFTQYHRLISALQTDKVAVLDLTASPTFKPDARGIDSRGPETFLELVGRAVMSAHGHPEVQGENVAWVDRDRRYLHVTDGFLKMIGYERDEVLGHLIDEFTYPGTADTKETFHRYLDDGHMSGRFILRHKSGHKVAIEYEAGILSDGCMYSTMRPLEERKKPRPSRRSDEQSIAQ